MLADGLLDVDSHRFQRWFAAGLVVVGLHAAGGTLGLMRWAEPEWDDEPSGAVLMELAPLAVAPPEVEDLALGPPAEAAVPTPIPTMETRHEELELPPLEEAPLAPDPEVVLPKARPVDTVSEIEEESELLKTEEEVTEVNTASSVPMSLRALDAAPDKTVKAQAAGATLKPSQAEITWQKSLMFHLKRHKRYPVEARSRRVQGVTQVEFEIDAGGHLVEARVVKSSGSPLLDEEALAILKRASPFPAPHTPPLDGTLKLAMPIDFKIK